MLFVLSCGVPAQVVQTAVVQTLTAFPTITVTPWPTSTATPVVNTYSLELGVCSVYVQYGGDPKDLGCTLLDTRSVSLAQGQEATASVASPNPNAYSYCALFAADGSYITSFINPNHGALHVQCDPSGALLPTAAPGTQTAVLMAQAAAQTAGASEVAVARTAVERQIRAYATADSATATAYFWELRATQTAVARQAHASATAFSATATRAFKVARATEVAQYSPIAVDEILAHAGDHIGEKVIVSGQVFDLRGNQIWIYVRGKDSVEINTLEPVTGITMGQSIRAYGTVEGTTCPAGAAGGQACEPVLIDAFYVEG